MGSFPETCSAVVSWFWGREQSTDDIIERNEETVTLIISTPRHKVEPTIVFATSRTIRLFLEIIHIFCRICGVLSFCGP